MRIRVGGKDKRRGPPPIGVDQLSPGRPIRIFDALDREHKRNPLASVLVWDNHGCMPLRSDASFLPQLRRYKDAGVNVTSINIGFADIPGNEHLKVLSFMRRWVSLRQDEYRLVATPDDVRRCQNDGKLGITFHVEGMCPVQDNWCLVQTFYELGVRWMLIAYNRNNHAGGGCLDEDHGLTATGRAIIDEIELPLADSIRECSDVIQR